MIDEIQLRVPQEIVGPPLLVQWQGMHTIRVIPAEFEGVLSILLIMEIINYGRYFP